MVDATEMKLKKKFVSVKWVEKIVTFVKVKSAAIRVIFLESNVENHRLDSHPLGEWHDIECNKIAINDE